MRYLFCITLGIFSVSYFPWLPNLIVLLIAAPLICLALFYYRYFCILALCIGATYSIVWGHITIGQQLPVHLDGKSFFVEGTVVGLPHSFHNKKGQHVNKFQLKIKYIVHSHLDTSNLPVTGMENKKIALSQYSSAHSPLSHIKTGDYILAKVKLKRPRGFVNPANFDYQLHLLQQNIMATGYVRKNQLNQKVDNRCHMFFIDCWRDQLRYKFLAVFDKHKELAELKDMRGLALGLLVGDKQLMSKEQWSLLKDTGTIHLLAISGLHIGLMAVIGFFLGRFFTKLFQILHPISCLHWLPSVLSILFATLYSCFAGFSLPTQRALIMVVVYHLFLIFYRKANPWLLFVVSLLIVAVVSPLSVHSQGFWLSFLAVAVLIFGFSGYRVKWRPDMGYLQKLYLPITGLVKAQWLITIGLFLPGILLLQGVSLSAPLANIIAVPFVSLITVPLLFLSAFLLFFSESLFVEVLYLTTVSLEILSFLLQKIQWLSLEFWSLGSAYLSLLGAAVIAIGIISFILPKGFFPRYIGLFCLFPLLTVNNSMEDLIRLTFLDVGQGTSVVVETKDHQLVYDTGRYYSERFDTGQHIIAPYLIHHGYQDIDLLVVSHSDHDHSGGTAGLLSLIDAHQYYSGEPDSSNSIQCQAGQQWQWDEINFSVLWPTAEFLQSKNRSSNNMSCVLLIEVHGQTILLTGDIEEKVEREMLKLYPFENNIDIILIPHHGSQTSSHLQWVKTLKPLYSIATAGYKNRYNHPDKTVVERYSNEGSKVLATATEGALQFRLNTDRQWHIQGWRKDYSRYWYD
ncbi:MAG: DNA internalization-related competence protein ComEC/Rec2 [Cellvibrionaceae bacterium]